MSTSTNIGWQCLNGAAEASGLPDSLKSINQPLLRTMTIAAMQAMLVTMHNPKPDEKIQSITSDAVIGLAEILFSELDRTGVTSAIVELAPPIYSLDRRAQALLFSLEQEILAPLGMPAEAWSLIWSNYTDDRVEMAQRAMKKKGREFRFSDSLASIEEQAYDRNDKAYDLKVPDGHRVIGTGIPLFSPESPEPIEERNLSRVGTSSRPPWWPRYPGPTFPYPGPDWPWPPDWPTWPTFPSAPSPFTGNPIIVHYSPFSWRKFLTTAGSIVLGSVNTFGAVISLGVSAGVSAASIGTAAVVGGWWTGGGK